ncbi:hypothetical protein Tsubulata_031143 [Turnera subulata]|uniref:J domain-containing protein n=1 Tax=Turnera subulata TaxID=218843 RepID=A0A9Q0FHQ3_9ROSI|nr:hypothetical protein Tsubulata_031143 [Turnera subulata]
MLLKGKKAWAPLSSILHRQQRKSLFSSSSTTLRFPITTAHQPKYPSPASYNPETCGASSSSSIITTTRSHHSLRISWKSFCSKAETPRCWSCKALPHAAPFLVCDDCRTIQPVDPSVDYFQIFGLEKKYEVEDGNLEGKYKAWQKKLHPDLVHSKSEKEREFAAEQSARVIDAYRTLTNSLTRAIYIMKIQGVDVDEEETISEPELLAEIMEIREAVEEAPNSKALNELKDLMQKKLQLWSDSFANAFQSQKFEEAINCIRRMKYYSRVNEEIVKRL